MTSEQTNLQMKAMLYGRKLQKMEVSGPCVKIVNILVEWAYCLFVD